MNLANITTLAATLAALAATADVTIETTTFTLTVGDDAVARSLVVKATGEETLDQRERIALFSSTQMRPFNNEIKLAHPNKRTTYQANRLRREGDRLVVGFHLAPYEAVVKVVEADGYAVFELVDFISDTVNEKQYGGLVMDVPPVADFRVVQLPVKNRANFGDWLNVSWDDKAAVAVIAAEPFADIDHEVRHGFRILRADLARGRRLRGGKAAIVAGAGEQGFLAAMERCERGLGLPNGVASRRNPLLNASIYWSGAVYPENVDDHIALARRGGFRLMLIFFPAFLEPGGYAILGDYTWNKHYPNGEKDVKAVLDKIRAAGITPGFHTLQTHIGMRSSYVTPVADPRLNLTRHFTLMRDVPETGAVDALFVSENPVDSVIAGDAQGRCARVLKFGGELFTYEGYATTPPYRFTGVRRGAFKTRTAPHRRGDIGGILDMSEFGATSCYIDQRTDLHRGRESPLRRLRALFAVPRVREVQEAAHLHRRRREGALRLAPAGRRQRLRRVLARTLQAQDRRISARGGAGHAPRLHATRLRLVELRAARQRHLAREALGRHPGRPVGVRHLQGGGMGLPGNDPDPPRLLPEASARRRPP